MAQRRFQIPGKLVDSSPGAVVRGPAGIYGLDLNNVAGIFEDVTNINSATPISTFTYHTWYHPLDNTFQYLISAEEQAKDQNVTLAVSLLNTAPVQGIQVRGDESASTNNNALLVTSDAAVFTLNAWNSVLISVDLSTGSAATGFRMYINDVSPAYTVTIFDNTTFAFDTTNLDLAAWYNPNANNSPDGYVGCVWFDIGTFIDFDVTANRRKFINASKRPVALGADGSLPTGSPPTMYFDNPPGMYASNRGSGPDFRYNSQATLDVNAFTTAPTTPATGTLA